MSIGENIKTARKALGLSQDDLAETIGANRVTISKYETGIYLPSVPALQRLADALNTTPAILTGGTMTEARRPITEEAQIISGGVDQMTKPQRQQVLNVVRAMFPDLFK